MTTMTPARKLIATVTPAIVLCLVMLVATSHSEGIPGGGSTSTQVSLLSVQAQGVSVDLGTGSGSSNNESGSMGARTDFFAARALELNIGEVTATADAANPEGNGTDEFLPIDVDSVLDASVTFAGAQARVDPSNYWAMASLGHATIDANVMNGLVEMTNVEIGFTNESSTSTSVAIEGISIEELALVPLSVMLDRVANLSADDLTDLAVAVGGQAAQDELAEIEQQRQRAISSISALLPLGLPGLPSTMSAQGVLDYAAGCSSEPTLTAVCPQIQAAVAGLDAAVATLEEAVGDMPLVSINTLNLGVAAHTADDLATSTAIASWGNATVAGIELMDIVDPDEAIALLIATVEQVEAALRQLPGLENLEIDITPLQTSTPSDPSGLYASASSQLDFLEVMISAPASGTVPQPLSVSIDVITMSASSQHRAASAPDPTTIPTANGSPSPTPTGSPTPDPSPSPSPTTTMGTNGGDPDPSPSPSPSPTIDPDPDPSPSASPTLSGSSGGGSADPDPDPSPSPSPTSSDGGSSSNNNSSGGDSGDGGDTEVQGSGFSRQSGSGSTPSAGGGSGGESSGGSGSGGSSSGTAGSPGSGCRGGCLRLANTGFDGRWGALASLLVALGGLMLRWQSRLTEAAKS